MLSEQTLRKFKDKAFFLRRALTAPTRVAAVRPCHDKTGKAFAEIAQKRPSRFVVEMGPGTGAMTEQLLQNGVPAEDLVLIELDPGLHTFLKHRFPEIRHIINGSATDVASLLASHGISEIGMVVSTFPLLQLPAAAQTRVLDDSLRLLANGGVFAQVSYLPHRNPTKKNVVKSINAQVEAYTTVKNTFPYETIWVYQREKNEKSSKRKAA